MWGRWWAEGVERVDAAGGKDIHGGQWVRGAACGSGSRNEGRSGEF